MKTINRKLTVTGLLLVIITAIGALAASAGPLIRNHGLPSEPAPAVLPHGAVLHLRFNNLYDVLLNVEKFALSTLPEKAVPQDAQSLLQSDHPLLVLLGSKLMNQPLTAEKVEETFGIAPTRPITATIYPGDPRKLFILSLPIAKAEVFENAIKNMAQPKTFEEIALNDKPAVRLELNINNSPVELFMVCSDSEAYICGDRSLAVALHATPPAERLKENALFKNALASMEQDHVGLVFNPELIKPMVMQLNQAKVMLLPLLQMQKQSILGKIPAEAKMRVEAQLSKDLGIKDLSQLADYLECFLVATVDLIGDSTVSQLFAFEGISLSIRLDGSFPKASFFAYSNNIQPKGSVEAIPMGDVRKAIAWLGPKYRDFNINGRMPEEKPSRCFISWLHQAAGLMKSKGLNASFIEKLENHVKEAAVRQPVATQTPWMVKACVALNPAPDIAQFSSVEDYLQALAESGAFNTMQPVTLLPGKDTGFLKDFFASQSSAMTIWEKKDRDFWKDITGKTAWLETSSRFHTENVEGGMERFVIENAYTTRGGIFGYDQHEWINRKIFTARQMDGYVIYHHGNKTTWLKGLDSRSEPAIAPAIAKLLDRVPEGANRVAIHQCISALPQIVDYAASFESLIHRDIEGYLTKANKIIENAGSLEAAKSKLNALRMPLPVYTLNRDGNNKLYCLLPINSVVFPRQKLLPLVKPILAGFEAKADQVGGVVAYTRVRPGIFEAAIMPSTEALSLLVKTAGNYIAENYLASQDQQQQLMRKLVEAKDNDPVRFEEVVVKNPQWAFLPGAKEYKHAKISGKIPSRDANADASLLDLSRYYNASLTQTWHVGGLDNNNLSKLPSGIQEFRGTKFDVRGLIQLSGKEPLRTLSVKFPKEVKDIKAGRKAGKLHFLHAAAWQDPDNTTIGRYIVHYANGEKREIPIVYGRDVRDWWSQQNEASADSLVIAWQGENSVGKENPDQRLFKTTWVNPLPDEEIKTIDFKTDMTDSAPFLLAITLE